MLGRKYGFQELEHHYWHHVTKGIDHQSILLEMVEIILDSMPTFGAIAACFLKLLTPEAYKLEISKWFQNSVLKIDLNLVTTGHGDINANYQIMDKTIQYTVTYWSC